MDCLLCFVKYIQLLDTNKLIKKISRHCCLTNTHVQVSLASQIYSLWIFTFWCLSEISFASVEASCTFEEDLCNFYQDNKDGPGWSRVKVKPNAYRPGDHTTGMGK